MTTINLQQFLLPNTTNVPPPLRPNAPLRLNDNGEVIAKPNFFSQRCIARVKNSLAAILLPEYANRVIARSVEKNKQVSSAFLSAIQSVYGQSSALESKYSHYFSGQRALTTRDAQQIVKSFHYQAAENTSKVRAYIAEHHPVESREDQILQEKVVRQVIEAIGATQVAPEQIQLMVEEKIARHFFENAGIDNNHIAPLLNCMQGDRRVSTAEWVTRYQNRDQTLLSSFNGLIKAFDTSTSNRDTLDALYQYANAVEFFAQFDPKVVATGDPRGSDDAMSYQKDLLSAKLNTLPKEQIEQLLKAILAHPRASEIVAFMSTPGISMDLATNCDDDERLRNNSIQAWGKPSAALIALVDVCAQRLGKDKQDQVNDWIQYCSNTKYAGDLSFIDRSFYADLVPLWKQHFDIDIHQVLPLPKGSGGVLDAAEAKLIAEGYEEMRREYQYLMTLNERQSKDETLSGDEQIENGLFNIFIKDLTRSSYTINGEKLDRTQSLDEKTKRFKQLIPDQHQQFLISYFANQSLFANVEQVLVNKLGGILGRAKIEVSYQITTHADGTVHLIANEKSQLAKFSALNAEDEDRYSALQYHIELSLSHQQTLNYPTSYLTLELLGPVRYHFTQREGYEPSMLSA